MRTSSKWLALVAFSLSTLVIGLDSTVLAVALPTLARALNATQSELQWFSTAFLLTVAGGMLPASVIADRAGRKKTLLAALIIFGGSALWGAYVTGPEQLIAARAIMGFAAALISVITLGVIPVLFDSAERAKAIGVMMVAAFLGLPIGPILGGWILTNFWWGWVFLMNVPVAGLAFVLVLTLVPESTPDTPGPFDLIGLVLSMGGLTALCYGFVRAGSNGWGDTEALSWIGGGVIMLVIVVGWEQHMAATGQVPLIPPSLFRVRGFTAGTFVPWIGQFALVGVLFIVPLYWQAVRNEDAMGSGIRLLPLIAGFIVAASLGDLLAKLLGPKAVATGGYLLMTAGVFLGARMTAASDDLYIAVWLVIAGLGMGLGLVTAASVALRYVPADKSNQASAVFQALQKTGGPLGAAVLGSALSQAYQQHLALPASLPGSVANTIKSGVFEGLAVADRMPVIGGTVRDAFDTGMATTLWICVGIAIAAALAALALLPSRVDAPDHSTATPTPEPLRSRNLPPGRRTSS